MDVKEQVTKLRALKEKFVQKQALLDRAKTLNEKISPTNISKLLENDLEQAKLILAARDVCDKLQKIAEHLAELGAEEIMPLADSMRGAFGPDAAATFEHAANENIQRSLETVRAAKDSINDAILKVEGKLPPQTDMMSSGLDTGDSADMAAQPATTAPAVDPFGGAPSASGPDDEPLGRAKKESRVNTKDIIEGKSFKYDNDDEDNESELARKKSKSKRDSVKMKRDRQISNLKTDENLNLRAAGAKLLEKYSLTKLMNWLLTEAGEKMSPIQYKPFARNAAEKALTDPEVMAGWIGKKMFGESAMRELAKPDSAKKSEAIAEAIARMIETNVAIFGKGRAAKVVETFLTDNGLMESEASSALEVFESKYGMKPAQYSIHIAKKVKEDPDDLTQSDNTNVAKAMGDIAAKIATDPSVASQPASNVIATANPAARTALQKVAQSAGTAGNPANVAQLVKTADLDLTKNKLAMGMTEAKRGNKGENVDDDMKNTGRPKKLKVTNAKDTVVKKSNIDEVKRGNKGVNVDDDVKNVGHPKKLHGTNAKNTITKEELITLGESKLHKKAKHLHPDYLLGIGAYYGGLARGPVAQGYAGCDGEKAASGWDAACAHDTGSASPAATGEMGSSGGAGAAVAGGAAPVAENINAAHWPTDSMGQYKGDPMSTNYGKYKVMMTTPKSDNKEVSTNMKAPAEAKKNTDKTEENTKNLKAKDSVTDQDKMPKKENKPKKSYEDEIAEASKHKVPQQFMKKNDTDEKQNKKSVKSPGPYQQPGSKKHKARDESKVIN